MSLILPIAGLSKYHMDREGNIYFLGPSGFKRRKILLNRYGRPVISIRRKLHKVHRIVCEHFHGPCPEGMVCRHLDSNPLNYHPSNLRWGTYSENQKDRTNLQIKNGIVHNRSKLTNKQVIEIRQKYATGDYFYKDLAKEYNVGKGQIGYIVRRDSWVHVTEEEK